VFPGEPAEFAMRVSAIFFVHRGHPHETPHAGFARMVPPARPPAWLYQDPLLWPVEPYQPAGTGTRAVPATTPLGSKRCDARRNYRDNQRRDHEHGRDQLRAPVSDLSARSPAVCRALPAIEGTTTVMPTFVTLAFSLAAAFTWRPSSAASGTHRSVTNANSHTGALLPSTVSVDALKSPSSSEQQPHRTSPRMTASPLEASRLG